ncbi:glycoside hydrolase [Candidatus Acetothermia bacterium]|nr:glycoside hydrolase [Candidatus Acetothermia bacterium]MCI2431302.1 glycoside hydrolase [Candidatus Acetothermia bacterium]MCI2436241.1 glycoside hydrolase [Candidatus Acetothermia bacterium]
MWRSSLWKWTALTSVAIMVPLVLVVSAFFLTSGNMAQGQTGWTISTVAEGGLSGKLVYNPDIAVDDGGAIYVAWADQRENKDVFLSLSTDGGASWGKAINVSNNSGLSMQPDIHAVGKGIVCLAWQDDSGGAMDIWARCSADGGATWLSDPVNVSNSPSPSGQHDLQGEWDGNLDIAINASPACTTNGFPTVYVVFTDDFEKLRFSVSKDGKSWQAAADLPGSSGLVRFPSAYVAATGVNYVAANDAGASPDVRVWRSTDCAATWSDPANASSNAGFSDAGQLAAIGDNVWVVYDDTTGAAPGDADNRIATSPDRGASWSEKLLVAKGAFPDIATDGKNLYVVYDSLGGAAPARSVGALCSTDQAANWKQINIDESAPARVQFRHDYGINTSVPYVAADSAGNVYVTWMIRVAGQPVTQIKVAKRTGC